MTHQLPETTMTLFNETLADIAYMAGCRRYYSGDSRADIEQFVQWANEFENTRKHIVDEDDNYMEDIEIFTNEKLNHHGNCEPQNS